jgi:type I restriction enzyme, S subunit
MSKLQPYTAYYLVQYDYVSQLPEGWQLLPNIAIFRERIERGFDKEELLSVTIGKGVIRQSDVDIKKDSSNEDKSKYKLIKVGDIAYNRMRMWQGALGYSDYQGITSPAYVVLKPKMEINQRFFHYMFRTGFYTNYSKRFSYGIVDDQLSLRYVDFKRMYSIVPPLETQNAIVAYLDRKTQQIQEFIAKKERLIELLEEQKGVYINEVICKYKTISICLKYLCNGITDGSHFSPQTLTEGKSYVTVTDVGKEDNIDLINCKKISVEDFIKLERTGCRPNFGDILLTKDGTIGRAYTVRDTNDFVALSSLAIITPSRKKILPELLRYILISPLSVDQMFSKIQGSALTRLTIGLIKNLDIVYPSSKEDQLKIVYAIENKHKELNKIILKAQTEIEKAKEYQESLMAQVVTGQLKVPEKANADLGQNIELGMVAEANGIYHSKH